MCLYLFSRLFNHSLTTLENKLTFFLEVDTTTHEQNIICSKSLLDANAHEQTIICRQFFVGHMVGSQGKCKGKINRMIILIIVTDSTGLFYFLLPNVSLCVCGGEVSGGQCFIETEKIKILI